MKLSEGETILDSSMITMKAIWGQHWWYGLADTCIQNLELIRKMKTMKENQSSWLYAESVLVKKCQNYVVHEIMMDLTYSLQSEMCNWCVAWPGFVVGLFGKCHAF